MKTAIIKANTKDLLQSLKPLKTTVRRVTKKAMSKTAKGIDCEITILDGKATFTVPGAAFSSECTTQGAAKATVPFLYFWDIISTHQKKEIEIVISGSGISIGILTIPAKTIFFENRDL